MSTVPFQPMNVITIFCSFIPFRSIILIILWSKQLFIITSPRDSLCKHSDGVQPEQSPRALAHLHSYQPWRSKASHWQTIPACPQHMVSTGKRYFWHRHQVLHCGVQDVPTPSLSLPLRPSGSRLKEAARGSEVPGACLSLHAGILCASWHSFKLSL